MTVAADPAEVRQELKFVGAETTYHELEAWLRAQPQGFRRAYPSRRINNIYFDCADFVAYQNSVSGASSRAKVRYRWYGAEPYPDVGQFEVKLKRDRVGWKLTYPVEGLDGTIHRRSAIGRYILDALPPEGRVWLFEYDQILIMNRYVRDYWTSSDGTLRVTLDHDQVIYDQRYSSLMNCRKAANTPRTVVLEVKYSSKDAEHVSRLVSTLPLALSRHSKYCNAVSLVEGF